MRINPIGSYYKKNYNNSSGIAFNGTKEEIISEGFKEFVSGALVEQYDGTPDKLKELVDYMFDKED